MAAAVISLCASCLEIECTAIEPNKTAAGSRLDGIWPFILAESQCSALFMHPARRNEFCLRIQKVEKIYLLGWVETPAAGCHVT